MKKLLLLGILSSSFFIFSNSIENLEKAIIEVDITGTRKILSTQTLTRQEKYRLCLLASQVARHREVWTREWITDPNGVYHKDISTPYKSDNNNVAIAVLASITFSAGGLIGILKYENLSLFFTMLAASFMSFLKLCYDIEKDQENYRKLLQQKYKDSLMIEQLIQATEVV